MHKVTDLKIAPADYTANGQHCTGSNLTYRVDGQRRSSRVPWVANNPAAEVARIERVIAETEKKKTAVQVCPSPSPKGDISTLGNFRK